MAINSTEEGRDAILDHFKARWDAGTPAVNEGAIPDVEWPNMGTAPGDEYVPPLSEGNKPWARVMIRHTNGEQASLGEVGSRRFERTGVVIVQVFVPAGKRGSVTGDRLGKVALDAFEGEESGDVWFKNAVQREVGVDGAWYQVNVSADFQYDVLK